jgi:hypothetical protein
MAINNIILLHLFRARAVVKDTSSTLHRDKKRLT